METILTKSEPSVPAEWTPQKAIWTAWPADPDEWNGDLDTPRRDVAAMVHALAAANIMRVLANGTEAEVSAHASIGGAAEIVRARYGDIWLRDTGPIFARTPDGLIALRFETNGWGGKFDLPGDDVVGDDIARFAGVPTRHFDFVLEGGAIEQDGDGTILTTRQTMLNANRNVWTESEAEAALRDAFGAEKIVWLDEGLKNDHTDGHIDNIARFVGPARVVCQSPSGPDDPNVEILDAVARTLDSATDARGRKLEVIRIPSPGLVLNGLGEPAPASHVNFVIANGVVVMPVYGTPTQDAARDALQSAFPDRKVIALPSRGLLGTGGAGGGSFHCITLQEPL
ncbi:MAG: agmatine deiminase family protein [Methyloceanibacter sp.]